LGKIFRALEKADNEKRCKVTSCTQNRSLSTAVPCTTAMEQDLIAVQKPHSMEAEQFRVLKNNLLFSQSEKAPRSIMITSTNHGEGKSFVASNLAVAIASSIDEHVLLIDCDLHNPSVHTMFGIANDKGLSDYLTRKESLPSLIQNTFFPKLSILTGGPQPMNPSELISSEQMRSLINEAEARYNDRYIILDAPPPLITSETKALAKYVKGILLVVKHGFTRKDHLHDIIDIYGREKILGVVYNSVKNKFGFHYKSKNRYGIKNKKGIH